MTRLTRSQKKGKKSSYTNRFLKKQVSYSVYPKDSKTLQIVEFLKSKKTNAVIMKVRDDANSCHYLPAPRGVHKGLVMRRGVDYGPIGDWPIGTTVCNVEPTSSSTRFFSAPGTSVKIHEKSQGSVALVVKSRTIKVHENSYALRGVVSNGNFDVKPYGKAGTKARIYTSKGKKYPEVSASAMNAQDHALGGSYKKRRGKPMTTARSAPPKAKFGSIAARRTGRK